MTRLAVETGTAVEDRADRPRDGRQRGAEIVGDRAQQRVAKTLGLDAHLGVLSLVGQIRPLDGQRDLVRERFELVELFGRVERVRIGGPHAEHAHGASRGSERQIERRRSRERAGPEAGELAMLVDPAADTELVPVHFILPARPRHQTIIDFGQEHGDAAAEDLGDVPDHDGQERIDAARARQLSTHRVERRGPLLTLARSDRLGPDPYGEAADHEADKQHDREGEEVADVGHGEGVVRGHEEEVERADAEDGGRQGGTAPLAHGDEDDPEQVHHDQIRQLGERRHEPRHAGGQRHRHDGASVRNPVGRDRAPTHRRHGRGGLALATDHIDVDVTAALDERIDNGADEDPFP